jgi:hypothetical protein
VLNSLRPSQRVLTPAVLQIALAALMQQNNVLKLRDATSKPETGFPLPQLSTRHVWRGLKLFSNLYAKAHTKSLCIFVEG